MSIVNRIPMSNGEIKTYGVSGDFEEGQLPFQDIHNVQVLSGGVSVSYLPVGSIESDQPISIDLAKTTTEDLYHLRSVKQFIFAASADSVLIVTSYKQ